MQLFDFNAVTRYNIAMPQDVMTLHALVQELAALLVGGRIDRITQPEKDEVCLYVRNKGATRCLVISANPNAPRMHLTTTKKDNPYAAPAFLMHLRRHVAGGMIQSLELLNFDRIVRMQILGRNEMHDAIGMSLYIELMGRYSNIIAVDSEGRISDALRHIPPAENQLRAILPHLNYELPPRGKLEPTDADGVSRYLLEYTGGDLCKYLFSGVAGMVNITARELLWRAGLSRHNVVLSLPQVEKLVQTIAEAYAIYQSDGFAPCYATDAHGDLVDYYVYPYQTADYTMIPTATINEAANIVSDAKDKALRLKASGKHLASVIDNAIKKYEKLLAVARQKLLDCQDNETLRVWGELLTANIYRLQKGMKEATIYNYYEDCDVRIPLDANLSPAENAQAYYKRYAKQKRTVAAATKQESEYLSALDYLQSVRTAFHMAEDNADLAEIEQELIQNGYIAAPRGAKKVRNPQPSEPARYQIEGFSVWRGRNNLQNERLTFHTAKETDVWLHVKAEHGSHVVIITQGAQVPPAVLQGAAEIAAYYSNRPEGGKVQVDYTPRKFVKHHPARKSGMVLYTDYQTVMVEPKAHKEDETN